MQRTQDTAVFTEGRDEKMTKHNLFETPRFFADVYVLRPGQSQSLHRHANEDKCYFVLSGRGTVTSGTGAFAVGPGQAVCCPAGEDHGVVNDEAREDLRLLVFMAPHPRPEQVG